MKSSESSKEGACIWNKWKRKTRG